jgi:hypothetical protein
MVCLVESVTADSVYQDDPRRGLDTRIAFVLRLGNEPSTNRRSTDAKR